MDISKTAHNLLYHFILLLLLSSCDNETCNIDFKKNSETFKEAVNQIKSLDLGSKIAESHREPFLRFNSKTSPIDTSIFNQVEYIELYTDKTIIFQAPNCVKGSGLRDVVYFIVYSEEDKQNFTTKKNTSELKKIEENWYKGKHTNFRRLIKVYISQKYN